MNTRGRVVAPGTLVPLDATDDVPFTSFFAEALAAHLASPEAEAVDAIIAANQGIFLRGGYSFWDTLATALVFRPELATWDEARVLVTASQDAGAGWIDRWDEGTPVRFAATVPDPLAFEREYLSVLTGETVMDVRPDPTVTISFDGRRCAIRPRPMSAGEQVVAYVDDRGRTTAGALLLQFSEGFTYADLRDLVGPDGSPLPRRTRPPKGSEILGFVGPLTEATTVPSVVAGLCTSGDEGSPGRVWLTPPVEVVH